MKAVKFSRRKGGEEQTSDTAGMGRWLLTYADMITLLLLFFIVLYAISTVNAQKFEAISESLNNVFNGGPLYLLPESKLNSGSGLQAMNARPLTTQKQFPTNMHYLYNKAQSFLRRLEENRQIHLTSNDKGFVISIYGDMYFAPSSAEINQDTYPVLMQVASFLNSVSNKVIVEGHTDNIPIESNVYPTNWDLSSARALNVLKTFENYGVDPARLSAAAFGSEGAVFSNQTEEGRAMNRRIDVIILETPLNP